MGTQHAKLQYLSFRCMRLYMVMCKADAMLQLISDPASIKDRSRRRRSGRL